MSTASSAQRTLQLREELPPQSGVIDELLGAFLRRRRRLRLMRGLGGFIASLIVGLLVVAAVDRAWVISDSLRLGMAIGIYSVAIVAAWLVAGRPGLRQMSGTDTALSIESLEPNLRDRLLAAIELEREKIGSEAFRELSRRDTAERTKRVRMTGLLPGRLAAKWIGLAAVALVVVVALVLVPGWRVGQLLGRAALPTADIPRVSPWSIDIELRGAAREDSTWLVPAGEAVSVAANVAGPDGRVPSVYFETPTGSTPAMATEAGQFEATMEFAGPTRLRGWASTADTLWLEIEPVERPTPVEFTIEVTPPDYLRGIVAPQIFTGASGDFDGIAGGRATVTFTTNQPIAGGTLELRSETSGGEQTAMPLDDIAQPRISFTLDRPAEYTIRLGGRRGFNSASEPTWTLGVRPDFPPVATLESPSGSVAGAKEVVSLRIRASDDLALQAARIEALVDDSWTTLAGVDTRATTEDRLLRVDLTPLGLPAGTTLRLRGVAVDAKGQQSESGELELRLVDGGPSLQQRAYASELQLLRATIEELREASFAWAEARDELDGAGDVVAQQRGALAEQHASAALMSARRAMDQAGNVAALRPATAIDPRRIGVLVGRAESALAAGDVEALLRSVSMARIYVDELDRCAKLDAALATLESIRDAVERFERGGSNDAALLRRLLQSIEPQFVIADEAIDDVRADLAGSGEMLRLLDLARRDLDRGSARIRQALGEVRRGDEVGDLDDAAKESLQLAARSRQRLLEAAVEMQGRLDEARLPAAEPLAMSRSLRELDSNAAALSREASVVTLASTLARRAALGSEFEIGLASAGVTASDLGLVAGAINARGGQLRLDTIADATAVLEAGIALRDLRGEAERLVETGAFDSNADAGAVSFLARLRQASQVVRDHLLTGLSDGLGPQSSGGVARATDNRDLPRDGRDLRRQLRDGQIPSRASMERFVGELLDIEAAIEPTLEAARAVLREEMSALGEVLREAAETADEAAQSLVDRAAVDDDVERALNALRADGMNQDLLSEPGRERARDVDDAVAMIESAAKAARESERPDDDRALAQMLREVAEHFDALERKSDASESRRALRAAEEALGLRDQLDEEYGRMERLAEMAGLEDEALQKALEGELSRDEAMQRELEKLSGETMQEAQSTLERAAEAERQIQDDLQREAERLARQAERNDDALSRDVRRAARRASQADLDDAAEALEQAAEQSDNELAESLEKSAETLDQAAKEAQQRAAEKAEEQRELQRDAADAIDDGRGLDEGIQQYQKSEQAGKEAQAAAEQAKAAKQLAEQSRELAQQARDGAGSEQQMQNEDVEARTRAAAEQEPIAEAAKQAAENLERAARHEERLGNQARQDAAAKAAESAQANAEQDVPQAADRAANSDNASEAAEAMDSAAQALDESASAAAKASQTPGEQAAESAPPSRASEELARALDEVDQRLSQNQQSQPGQPGQQGQADGQQSGQQSGQPSDEQPGQQSGQSSAQQAAQNAAAAQAASMQRARMSGRGSGQDQPPSPGGMPGEGQQPGRAQQTPDVPAGLESLGERPQGESNWGDLPPKVVDELMRGQREVTAAEYRDLVEQYYRAVAERSRQQKDQR